MCPEEYIALRIKELCKIHGLTKYKLAQKTGISQTALANMISQKSIPTVPTLQKICDAFGITLAQFFVKGEGRENLTDLQKEILDTWDELDSREREILISFVRSLKKK